MRDALPCLSVTFSVNPGVLVTLECVGVSVAWFNPRVQIIASRNEDCVLLWYWSCDLLLTYSMFVVSCVCRCNVALTRSTSQTWLATSSFMCVRGGARGVAGGGGGGGGRIVRQGERRGGGVGKGVKGDLQLHGINARQAMFVWIWVATSSHGMVAVLGCGGGGAGERAEREQAGRVEGRRGFAGAGGYAGGVGEGRRGKKGLSGGGGGKGVREGLICNVTQGAASGAAAVAASVTTDTAVASTHSRLTDCCCRMCAAARVLCCAVLCRWSVPQTCTGMMIEQTTSKEHFQ